MRQNIASVQSTGWIDGLITFLDVLNESIFVDYEGRTTSVAAFLVEDAIVPDDAPLGKVAEDGKSDAVLFGKFPIGKNAVCANAENLGVIRFEFGDISLIRLHFLRSTAGKGKDEEGEHHIFLALEVA